MRAAYCGTADGKGIISAMTPKAILAVLTVLCTAAGALAAEEAVDGFTGLSKPKGSVIWMSVVLTVVFLLAALAIAFKDSRRGHLD